MISGTVQMNGKKKVDMWTNIFVLEE
jgi:hypothetical protein